MACFKLIIGGDPITTYLPSWELILQSYPLPSSHLPSSAAYQHQCFAVSKATEPPLLALALLLAIAVFTRGEADIRPPHKGRLVEEFHFKIWSLSKN